RVPDRDRATPSPADVGNPDLGDRRRGGRRGCGRHWRSDLDPTAAEHSPEESARRGDGRTNPSHEAGRPPAGTVRVEDPRPVLASRTGCSPRPASKTTPSERAGGQERSRRAEEKKTQLSRPPLRNL